MALMTIELSDICARCFSAKIDKLNQGLDLTGSKAKILTDLSWD